MSSEITSQDEDVTLHCPSCGEENFRLLPMSGKNGERFVRIHCDNCGEHLFFQTPEFPENMTQQGITPENWKTEQIKSLQANVRKSKKSLQNIQICVPGSPPT